jgi:uncharacterized membrane protein
VIYLLLWFLAGLAIRLVNLTGKPPWTDEFSTLVFSLGNSFLSVPLDQVITPDTLLQPLCPQPTATIQDVWTHLRQETNHPPLYFILAHWWMGLFPTQGGLASLWGARSLAVVFGALSVPAIYGLGWLGFRSSLVGHLAAAMMAVSPYAIFLAQEARHYTLGILWVIASLGCLVVSTRHIQNGTQLPSWLVICWVVVNALGMATHYFFALTLGTEALVLIFLVRKYPLSPCWQGTCAVAISTFVVGSAWLPVFFQNIYGSQLTDWIQYHPRGLAWFNPIFQAFGAWVTMLYLLPLESPQRAIVLVSGLVMLVFIIWAAPILVYGLRVQLRRPKNRLITQVFGGVVGGALVLFSIITYLFGIDLTRGARYNFVYFPAVIVLLGASLAGCWYMPVGRWGLKGKKAVVLVWLMGFLSALTVVCNLGYQKYYRPDLLVQLIQQTSPVPILIATTQTTHVQVGEMMGVAWELKRPDSRFLLVHQDGSLEHALAGLSRPLDLWLVNFHAPVVATGCLPDTQPPAAINGYEYQLYHCHQMGRDPARK